VVTIVKFELVIESGNEAMQNEEDVAASLRHISKKLVKRFRRDYIGGNYSKLHSRKILDENGNSIGHYTLTIDADK
jgi:hypothetical protein